MAKSGRLHTQVISPQVKVQLSVLHSSHIILKENWGGEEGGERERIGIIQITKVEFLAVGEECKASDLLHVLGPTPNFVRKNLEKLWVPSRGNLSFCVLNTPLSNALQNDF